MSRSSNTKILRNQQYTTAEHTYIYYLSFILRQALCLNKRGRFKQKHITIHNNNTSPTLVFYIVSSIS